MHYVRGVLFSVSVMCTEEPPTGPLARAGWVQHPYTFTRQIKDHAQSADARTPSNGVQLRELTQTNLFPET